MINHNPTSSTLMKTSLLTVACLIALTACTGERQESAATKEITLPIIPTHMTNTKKGFKANIETESFENSDFRRVLYTGAHMQLVLMNLKPGEEIGAEVHEHSDQFFRIESGTGTCTINNTVYPINSGDVIIAPAGSTHNVVNTDTKLDMKIYTIYAIPNHKDGIVRATKKEAALHETKFDGKLTEQ
jgi:mannose-6-phosphate isomerase-like protein (cupin superfamily)